MIDIAIIGAGPAGMTASVYARRAGYSVTVFELGMPGGQLSTTDKIENFPGYPEGLPGAELGMKFYEHAQAFGAEFVFEQVVRVEADGAVKKVVTNNGTEEKEYEARAIIIATGAHPRTLGVPGEDTFRGHGVSYCGTCDGFFFRGKDVCVVGGGDVAVEDAIYLANMCNSVTVFHRRDELRANKRSQDAAFANGKITFVWNTIVTELKGDDQLRSVVTKNVKTDEVKEWTFDGCFIFVGYDPNQDVYPQGLATDERGYVLTDENMATNIPGVYAVGDVRKKNVRQVATAVGDGGIVMSDIERYFREGGAQA
ncbi:MAG: thioredoxin-disulfide reductase [Peptococcaceae bacterium]|jgi:thioredoxin reductase (NADPH)|nr:thioredoxin-disulfide reductase [Peptococcaceae bacterium]MEE0205267.1 thioredoxin-disulfide reductase [Peptococcaceae bacterium]